MLKGQFTPKSKILLLFTVDLPSLWRHLVGAQSTKKYILKAKQQLSFPENTSVTPESKGLYSSFMQELFFSCITTLGRKACAHVGM